MVYRGHVRGNKIELEGEVRLPDGAAVSVTLVGDEAGEEVGVAGAASLRDMLKRHAGTAAGLPPDAAKNLDHYLYGLPKR